MFVCQKCKNGYYPKLNDENLYYDKLEGFLHQIVQIWVLCLCILKFNKFNLTSFKISK